RMPRCFITDSSSGGHAVVATATGTVKPDNVAWLAKTRPEHGERAFPMRTRHRFLWSGCRSLLGSDRLEHTHPLMAASNENQMRKCGGGRFFLLGPGGPPAVQSLRRCSGTDTAPLSAAGQTGTRRDDRPQVRRTRTGPRAVSSARSISLPPASRIFKAAPGFPPSTPGGRPPRPPP